MKKIVFFASLLIVTYNAMAQMAITTAKASETQHDFGKFREEAGRQTYDFYFTNTGSEPLVIQNIQASCGCTTPEWTKQPVPPGGKARVTAIYDPKDRPGPFSKTLSVYTNTKPEVTVLTIKGEVTPREKTIEELFVYPVGGVRFEMQQLSFTNVKKNEKKIRTMQVVNTSKGNIKIEFDNVPAHLSLKVIPEVLKPGQKGTVEGTFDALKNPAWGPASDYIRIKLNGEVQKEYYYTQANLVEDFSSLSKEQLANAPVFKIASEIVDLGKIESSSKNEVEFKFTNAGKSDLFIRNVRSTCGCTAVQQGEQGKPIKPGESGSIKATFNSSGYTGSTTKYIYVYANDPLKSEVVLTLKADVNQSTASK